MSTLQNINDIKCGVVVVIISSILPKDEKGLTVKETAEVLNISVSRLEQIGYNNEGPRFYKEDSKVLYMPSRIKAFMQSNTNNNKKKGSK